MICLKDAFRSKQKFFPYYFPQFHAVNVIIGIQMIIL